jgi:hypothetical protein
MMRTADARCRLIVVTLLALIVASCGRGGTRDAEQVVASPQPSDRVPEILEYCPVPSEGLSPEPAVPSATPAAPTASASARTLFVASAKFTGPWRIGALGLYDGSQWRAEPINDDAIVDAPRVKSGAVASFELRRRTTESLPALPNLVGVESDVRLGVDRRTGSVRPLDPLPSGPVRYRVWSRRIPSIDEVRQRNTVDPNLRGYLRAPRPPRAIAVKLASVRGKSLWDRLDVLRQELLDNAVAAGPGVVVPVPPARVVEMMSGADASPFEIVAAQTLLARWAGLPARIGFGYDKGDPVASDKLVVESQHGALWVEVHFSGLGWLPIIGDPKRARARDC